MIRPLKRDTKFNFTKAYKAFLVKYAPLYSHETSQYDLVKNMSAELDEIVDQGMAKAIHYQKSLKYDFPLPQETGWIEYEPQLKGHYPEAYGRYLVTKSSDAMVFLNWGPERWGLSDSSITHFRKIDMP